MTNDYTPDYQVHLDSFHGPLDLLLYLVKREEVDVRDIPVARITEQFKAYLDVLTLVDVERAGDFLVMASTLMEIKSKLLLPRPEGPGGQAEEDPRLELVRQLLEYKRFKEAAALLEARAERQGQRLPRQPVSGPAAGPAAPPLKPVELWDLVSAFARLMRETHALRPQTVVVDDTPQHVYEEEVRRRVRAEGRVAFRDLFTPPYHKARLIGLFLAVLELIRGRVLWIDQPEPFGEIWLSAPAEQAPG